MKIGIILGHAKTGGGGPHVVNGIIKALNKQNDVVTYTFTKHDNGLTTNKSVIPIKFGRLVILQQCNGARVARLARDCDLLVYPDFLIGIPDTKKPVIIYNHSGYRSHQKNEYHGILKLRPDPLLFSKPVRPTFQAHFRQAARSASHSSLWFTSPQTTSLIRSYFFSGFRYLSPIIRHVLTFRMACST